MAPFTSAHRLFRRRIAAAAAVACAALALSVTAALAATQAPGQAAPALLTAPRCGIAHPILPGGAYVWAASIGDGFAGGVGYVVEITNVGRRPCTVKGVPGVAAVRNGQIVGTRIPGSPDGPLITLQPRVSAHVGLIVRNAFNICGHPVRADVYLYLSGHKTGQDTSLTVLACRGRPGGGVLSVSVIKARTGIPLYDH